ncbi:8055_t:CDS:10 [Gigaspora margarita]|uniref:8055_t:CDS:1 n=1 Tax=Gigaspora margarita TaxID=4874 RepID=A0ABN7V6J8_GIGMA|nr:8055_t:CDS:10 [Gigaspora margarita]
MQAKVRSATSNDPWGPSGTDMNTIAQATYNPHYFIEIMEMIDKRLNDHGKNWRHVFKALTLLDYCLHVGSTEVVAYAKENLYVVKTLREFQYIDDDGKDQGANVRQKAKDITNLLQDDERLNAERRKRANMRDRLTGSNELPGSISDGRKLKNSERNKKEKEDLERAIKLSEEEEEKRRTMLEKQNEKLLFDSSNSITSSGSLASNFSSPNLTTSTTSFDVFNSSKQQPVLKPNSTDEKHPELAALFGNIGEGGGMDTFGNTGNLRVPAGSGFANSILNEPSNSIHSPRRSNSTGNLSQQNPFLNSGDTNNVSSGTFNTLPSNFNSSFTNVNQPASSFSTSSYTTTSLPTSNSLIDLDTGSFSSQASKNPFQTQQTISSSDINKPKSLMDIQREQQLLQQSQGFNQGTNVGFGNPWLS